MPKFSKKSSLEPKASESQKKEFSSLRDVLAEKAKKLSAPVHAKYEFQEYGIWLSEQLHDKTHRSLYIKLSKLKPRPLLQEAMIFAIGYNTASVNRGKLFMWKLAELEKEKTNKSK